MEQISQIIEAYGIYAVFALCTVEGDITLLLSGVMAHNNSFGSYSFFRVLAAGTLGGIAGDSFGYFVGRFFRHTVKDYKFYQMAEPRIERLIEKFGGFAVVLSKYIYGIRAAMCVSMGVGRMPYLRFLILDTVSCFIWSFILAGAGYFFSGAITNIIGDFHRIGYVLFGLVVVGVIGFYLIERFWLSKKVEEANPETIHKIEDKLHNIEEAAQEKLQDLGEKLHLTNAPNKEDRINKAEESAEITPPKTDAAAK